MNSSTVNKRLFLSVFAVNFLAFATGNAYAWSSTVLISLKSTDPQKNPLGHPITSSEESWIASLISLGASVGPILAGYCSGRFGRKKTLLIFSVPMFMSHLILAFASTVIEYFIARFMMGLGAGCVFTVVPIYVGEIAETKIRGRLGCMMSVCFSNGLLLVYAVGPYVNVMTLSSILILPISLFLIFFGLFVPESPYYYMSEENQEAAEMSLTKLRITDISRIRKELADIEDIVKESKSNSSLSEVLGSRSFRRGITITATLMVAQQFVGITIILSYMESIFAATGSSMSSSTSTIVVALLQTLTVLLSSSLVDKWGRRVLLIIACGGCALPLAMLSIFFYMKNTKLDVSNLWWLPILSLVIYIVTFNFGLGSLPWALVGELFSTKTKALASSITALTCLMLAFLMTLIFPSLEQLIGFHGAFGLFSAAAVASLLFVLWYVPETKGKSFQEILKILEK